jgi:hypothetical protein
MARHDELQGIMCRLPTHTLLVEPQGQVQGRADRDLCQRESYSGAGRAGFEVR